MTISKVLVVDDDPPQLAKLMKIIQEAGYVTLTATSGEDAIAKAKADHPDAILMDVIMKQVDGFAATREIRKDASTKDIPVVFVTSKGNQADKVWGKMVGGNGYVVKPYTPEDVLTQLKAVC
jgi:twitching motility two-component system response regulator PilH